MNRHPSQRLDGLLILTLLFSGALEATANPEPWRVQVRGSDVTTSAAPSERGDTVVVNVSALASTLRLSVRTQGIDVVIVDVSGAQWHGRQGQSTLDGLGQHQPLASPIVMEGNSVYLPIEAVAALAGLDLILDGRIAKLETAGAADANFLAGWKSFTEPKSAEELARDAANSPEKQGILTGPGAVARLPQSHDSLRLSTDLGYVQGADWGNQITASGKIAGVQIDLDALTTLGNRGLESVNRRLTLLDPETGWGAEAGDIYSEIRGSASGLRASLKVGHNHWPAISLYLKDSEAGYQTTVLSFRDEIAFTTNLALGGEAATDGSLMLKSRFQRSRLNLSAFYLRSPREDLGGGGFNAGYSLKNGMSLQGSVNRSGSGLSRTDSRYVSLSLPILRALDLSLDYSNRVSATNRSNIGGASLRFPLGPARLYVRYQLQDTTIAFLIDGSAEEVSFRQQSLLSSLSYSPFQQFSFSVEGSTSWAGYGLTEPRAQLVATYQFAPRIRFQVAGAFPNIVAPEQMRLRLDLGLPKDFAIVAEYGRLSPFQSDSSIDPDQQLFKLTLRKQFNIATPASGGRLYGMVKDRLGQPLPGAGVQLGSYTAVADPEGRYTFKNVPSGSYEAMMSREGLPANYGTQEPEKRLTITKRSRESVDFEVVQLDVVRGWVYCDRNSNGSRDPEEGVERIPLQLDGKTTASEKDGSFAFYNLAPGPYSVQVPVQFLPETFALDSPAGVAVELVAGKPSSGLEFRLIPKDMATLMQELEPAQPVTSGLRKPVASSSESVAARSKPAVVPASRPEPSAQAFAMDSGARNPSHGAFKEAMDHLTQGHAVEIRLEAGFYYVLADGKPTGAFHLLTDVPLTDGPLGEAAELLASGASTVMIERNQVAGGQEYLVRRGQPQTVAKIASASRREPGVVQYQRDLLLRIPYHGALKEAMEQLERGRSVEIRSEAGFYHVKANGEPIGAFRLLSDESMPGGALGEAEALLSSGASVVRIERHEDEAGPGFLVRRAFP